MSPPQEEKKDPTSGKKKENESQNQTQLLVQIAEEAKKTNNILLKRQNQTALSQRASDPRSSTEKEIGKKKSNNQSFRQSGVQQQASSAFKQELKRGFGRRYKPDYSLPPPPPTSIAEKLDTTARLELKKNKNGEYRGVGFNKESVERLERKLKIENRAHDRYLFNFYKAQMRRNKNTSLDDYAAKKFKWDVKNDNLFTGPYYKRLSPRERALYEEEQKVKTKNKLLRLEKELGEKFFPDQTSTKTNEPKNQTGPKQKTLGEQVLGALGIGAGVGAGGAGAILFGQNIGTITVFFLKQLKNLLFWSLKKFKDTVVFLGKMLAAPLTLGFKIIEYLAEMGGESREEIRQIDQSLSDTRDKFGSLTKELIKNRNSFAKELYEMRVGQESFYNPTSFFSRTFGKDVEGITNAVSKTSETLDSMKNFSEVFTGIFGDMEQMAILERLVGSLGLESEDVAYHSQEAVENNKHVLVYLGDILEERQRVSKINGVDEKRLSHFYNTLRKDITNFDAISDKSLLKISARFQKIGLDAENVSEVINKFSTFEDAAKSAAMLSQTFGMRIDPLKLIETDNPLEIINMFEKGLKGIGRTFDSLNRHERKILADNTGLSIRNIKTLMMYRKQGYSLEAAQAKIKADDPTNQQIKALKNLTTALNSFKESMNIRVFTSGLDALRKSFTRLITGVQGKQNVLNRLNKQFEDFSVGVSKQGKEAKVLLSIAAEQINPVIDAYKVNGKALGGLMSNLTDLIGNFYKNEEQIRKDYKKSLIADGYSGESLEKELKNDEKMLSWYYGKQSGKIDNLLKKAINGEGALRGISETYKFGMRNIGAGIRLLNSSFGPLQDLLLGKDGESGLLYHLDKMLKDPEGKLDAAARKQIKKFAGLTGLHESEMTMFLKNAMKATSVLTSYLVSIGWSVITKLWDKIKGELFNPASFFNQDMKPILQNMLFGVGNIAVYIFRSVIDSLKDIPIIGDMLGGIMNLYDNYNALQELKERMGLSSTRLPQGRTLGISDLFGLGSPPINTPPVQTPQNTSSSNKSAWEKALDYLKTAEGSKSSGQPAAKPKKQRKTPYTKTGFDENEKIAINAYMEAVKKYSLNELKQKKYSIFSYLGGLDDISDDVKTKVIESSKEKTLYNYKKKFYVKPKTVLDKKSYESYLDDLGETISFGSNLLTTDLTETFLGLSLSTKQLLSAVKNVLDPKDHIVKNSLMTPLAEGISEAISKEVGLDKNASRASLERMGGIFPTRMRNGVEVLQGINRFLETIGDNSVVRLAKSDLQKSYKGGQSSSYYKGEVMNYGRLHNFLRDFDSLKSDPNNKQYLSGLQKVLERLNASLEVKPGQEETGLQRSLRSIYDPGNKNKKINLSGLEFNSGAYLLNPFTGELEEIFPEGKPNSFLFKNKFTDVLLQYGTIARNQTFGILNDLNIRANDPNFAKPTTPAPLQTPQQTQQQTNTSQQQGAQNNQTPPYGGNLIVQLMAPDGKVLADQVVGPLADLLASPNTPLLIPGIQRKSGQTPASRVGAQ